MDSQAPRQSDATIGDLQARLESALKSLGSLIVQGRLPKELEPLLQLAPEPGARAHVTLHREEPGRKIGRDIPDHAKGGYWQPGPGHVAKVSYEVEHQSSAAGAVLREQPPQVPQASVHLGGSTPFATQLLDFALELDRVERGPMPYIVLTWFLKNLPASRFPWAADERERQAVLDEALRLGLVVTGKIDHPKEPGRQVTTLQLNRESGDVRRILADAKQLPRFEPMQIDGEPLSEQIIRERR